MKWIKWFLILILSAGLSACQSVQQDWIGEIEEYDGYHTYTVLNENIPEFDDISSGLESGEEYYSSLDRLDRCGMAAANLGIETMPVQERESIGMIKPSGWQISKYDHVDGKYLYNRCHLIGFQLSGENANPKNLITGTRYFNVEGMLPFENQTAEYIRNTGNHVLYEVTPLFVKQELVARGVHMQAKSVEDDGLAFNVFVYNVQPGVHIDYATGNNEPEQIKNVPDQDAAFVINEHSKKFHIPSCEHVSDIKAENRRNTDLSREALMELGYEPAECCDKSVDLDQQADYIINTNSKKFHKADCSQAGKIKPEHSKKVHTTYHDLVNQGYIPSKCCL